MLALDTYSGSFSRLSQHGSFPELIPWNRLSLCFVALKNAPFMTLQPSFPCGPCHLSCYKLKNLFKAGNFKPHFSSLLLPPFLKVSLFYLNFTVEIELGKMIVVFSVIFWVFREILLFLLWAKHEDESDSGCYIWNIFFSVCLFGRSLSSMNEKGLIS